MQNDINNPYLQKSAALFQSNSAQAGLLKLSELIPAFANVLRMCFLAQVSVSEILTKVIPSLKKYIPEMPAYWLMNRVQDVVDLRTKSSSDLIKRVDLLQLMIDASTNEPVQVRFLLLILLFEKLVFFPTM